MNLQSLSKQVIFLLVSQIVIGCSVADKDWSSHVYDRWQEEGDDYFSQYFYYKQYENLSPDLIPAGVDPRLVNRPPVVLNHAFLTLEKKQQLQDFQALKLEHFHRCDELKAIELASETTQTCQYQDIPNEMLNKP